VVDDVADAADTLGMSPNRQETELREESGQVGSSAGLDLSDNDIMLYEKTPTQADASTQTARPAPPQI
jgi:hypothetical protein